MLQSFFSRHGVRAALRALTAFMVLSVGAGGCTEGGGAADGVDKKAAAKPTSEDLYIKDCASCHGVDGTGNGPLASQLAVPPINLRLLKKANGGDFPFRDVQRSIDGRTMPRSHGLPDMPVWAVKWIREGLSEPELRARALSITSHIASIQE